MKMPFKIFLLLLPFISGAAYAGAWVQPAGKGQYIQNNSYYSTSSYFDNNGHQQPTSHYRKFDINPYAEYGVNDWFTIGTNLSLQQVSQKSASAGEQKSWGIGDSEFFARARLWQADGFVISAEPMVKLPSPLGAHYTPQIGGQSTDVGLSLFGGYGYSAFGQNHFLDAGIGYRHRLGEPKDQLKFSATAGFGISEKWMIMPQLFLTQRTGKPTFATFTQSSGDDYNLTKLQLSAVYKYDENLSLQAGYFRNVAGRNAGAGDGLLFSFWKSF